MEGEGTGHDYCCCNLDGGEHSDGVSNTSIICNDKGIPELFVHAGKFLVCLIL